MTPCSSKVLTTVVSRASSDTWARLKKSRTSWIWLQWGVTFFTVMLVGSMIITLQGSKKNCFRTKGDRESLISLPESAREMHGLHSWIEDSREKLDESGHELPKLDVLLQEEQLQIRDVDQRKAVRIEAAL